MSIRNWTIAILIANTALLIIWDIFAVWKGGVDATISRVLWQAVKAYPGFAIAIGGLLGHLFFSQT